MSETEQETNYVELVDISKDTAIAKAPLAAITHLPRTGEGVFFRSSNRAIGQLILSYVSNIFSVANSRRAKRSLSLQVWLRSLCSLNDRVRSCLFNSR
jgi:hypothetical protein